MTNEDIVELYQAGHEGALDILTEKNSKLICFIASKLRIECNHIDIEDLIQEGWFGLLRAAKTFKPGKAKFTTWAVYWISQRMRRYLDQKTPKRKEVSLHEPIADGLEIGDTIEDIKAERKFWDRIYLLDLRFELQEAMSANLSLHDTEVLKMWAGWDGKASTYQEIADLFGLSLSKVYDNYRKSLRKLRTSKWSHLYNKEIKARRSASAALKSTEYAALINLGCMK